MNITIVIDGELSQADKDILLALAGGAPAAPAGTMPPIGQGEPEVKERKKPGPKPKAKTAEAEKPAEPEPEKPAEPETEKPEPAKETDAIESAVARAAELLQSGEVKRVKSVLEELGAARVSSLKPAQVPEFLEKLA